MRTLHLITVFFLIAHTSFAQGIQFFEGTWEEAVAKAGKEKKHLFVDAYTTWCGPCKKMAADIFPLQEVGEFFNEHFVNVKLDMEKEGDGLEMAKRLVVRYYPSYIFFDPTGEPLHRAVGSMEADAFLEVAKSALDPARQYYPLKHAMSQHLEDANWLLDFALAITQAGESTKEIIAVYEEVSSPEEWQIPENFDRILQLQVPFESKLYEFVATNRASLLRLVEHNTRIESFLYYPRFVFLMKHSRSKQESELQPAFEIIQRVLPPDQSPGMIAQLYAEWYKNNEPEKAFEKMALYMDGYCNQANELNSAAWSLVEDESATRENLEKGLAWVDKSIALERYYGNLDTKAWILKKLGRTEEARAWALQAIEEAEANGEDHSGTDELLKTLP